VNTTIRQEKQNYAGLLDKSLKMFFNTAWRITLRRPSQAFFFFRTVLWQRKAARTRAAYKEIHIQVPPIIVYSITERCNLRCKGCYAHALHDHIRPEMSAEKMRETIREGRELGVSFMVLAGGEPLVRAEVLDTVKEYKDVIFFIFTNGTLINDTMADHLKQMRNVVPILSLEGNRAETDLRRGGGVYQSLMGVIGRLKKRGIFFGTSVTLTRTNIKTVTDERFVRDLNKNGCQLFFFTEYTPIDEGTDEWEVTDGQRQEMARTAAAYRKKYPALFVNLPDDEKEFGGCLAAGRGFVHISAQGDVEPCVFAPYSDTNLRDSSLKDALLSPFLTTVRENSSRLEEGSGGCALWKERAWMQSMLHSGENSTSPTDEKVLQEIVK
jgi:MoaA/NifB/PqqE/SkfB family radical SAM enzyme